MADQQSAYPYPSTTTQLEHLAGAAQQASSPPSAEYGTPSSSHQQRPPNPRKRRADGGPIGSRGVANLTPDQLARKRANDREAQRAIRERHRTTIERLEGRIKELEAQDPFIELQNSERSREAVMQENEELKKTLAKISALVAAHITGQAHGLEDLALATSRQAPLPLPQAQQQQDGDGQERYAGYDGEQRPVDQQHLHPDLRLGHHAPAAPMQIDGDGATADSQSKNEQANWQRDEGLEHILQGLNGTSNDVAS